VTRIAVGTLLIRGWPSKEGHDAALRVGGFLARFGWSADDIAHFVHAVAYEAGDPHARDHARTARDAADAHARGERVYGFPALQEFFGEKQANLIARWLGVVADAPASVAGVIGLDDFVSYLPEHSYIYMRTGAHWPGSSVDARLPRVRVGVTNNGTPIMISPSDWLDRNRRAEVQTWMPGKPTLIKGHEFTENDGLKPHADSTTFNLYHPPTIELGDPSGAGRWLDLIEELYPSDKDHIVRCFAHARQRPHIKINHVLFLGGDQGIGKDSIVVGLERAVGFSNFNPITPSQIIESQFNGEFKTVVLYISEVHDLGIRDRIKFYNVMKDKLAVPPTNIRINEKFRQPLLHPEPPVCHHDLQLSNRRHLSSAQRSQAPRVLVAGEEGQPHLAVVGGLLRLARRRGC